MNLPAKNWKWFRAEEQVRLSTDYADYTDTEPAEEITERLSTESTGYVVKTPMPFLFLICAICNLRIKTAVIESARDQFSLFQKFRDGTFLRLSPAAPR